MHRSAFMVVVRSRLVRFGRVVWCWLSLRFGVGVGITIRAKASPLNVMAFPDFSSIHIENPK